MPVKMVDSDIDVLTAARKRIENVFKNGCKVYLSFHPVRTHCASHPSRMI